MQTPATGSALCAGTPIYDDCDKVDKNHINSMSMEFITAIAKLGGEGPVDFDCTKPATYDQLCRGILKAIADAIKAAGCAADVANAGQLDTICGDLENHYTVTWLADGTPVRIPLSKLQAELTFSAICAALKAQTVTPFPGPGSIGSEPGNYADLVIGIGETDPNCYVIRRPDGE